MMANNWIRSGRAAGSTIRTAATFIVALFALVALVAACGGEPLAESVVENAQPPDDGDPTTDNSTTDTADSNDTDQGAGQPSDGREVQRVAIPRVPPITAPDLSELTETGAVVETALGDLVGPETGLDVVSTRCGADGLVYHGQLSSGSFLDADVDGSGTYNDATTGISIAVAPDGSGTYSDATAGIGIDVAADGSGTYSDSSAGVSLAVAADGTGSYSNAPMGLSVDLVDDGSGSYSDAPGGISIDVEPDGSGSYSNASAGISIRLEPDGTWFYSNSPEGISLTVNADGSGSYSDSPGSIVIDVDANGSGTYSSASAGISTSFTTEIGILDPGVLVAGPVPAFAVAGRFPLLDTLGQLEPPCATIIRLDADVLFDFDSDQLRPEAAPVVASVATALASNDQVLEIHGHTDSIGDDAYNQDLSNRRATAFEAALLEAGVSNQLTTIGFGEGQPAAPNENADGTDNPAGRQLNRRIEIVIPE